MKATTKAILLSTLILFGISGLMAQSLAGIKAGVQLARMTGVEGNPQGFLTALQVKFENIIPLADEISLTPSIGYSGKGYQWNSVEFTDQYGNPVGQGQVVGIFNYIQLALPLSYKVPMDKKSDLYIGVGPYVAYAISGTGKVKHVAIPNGDDKRNLFEDDLYKRMDAGMVVEFTSVINRKFLASVNADIGLANVNNGGGAKLKQLAAGLSVGYLFNHN